MTFGREPGIRRRIHRQLEALSADALALVANVVEAIALDPANQCAHASGAPRRQFSVVRNDRPRTPSLLEPLREPYFLCSTGGVVSYASPALVAFFECSAECLLREGWIGFLDGADEQRRILEKWLLAAQRAEKGVFTYTVRVRTGRGRRQYAFVRVSPCLHPTTGDVTGFHGAVYPQLLPAWVISQLNDDEEREATK